MLWVLQGGTTNPERLCVRPKSSSRAARGKPNCSRTSLALESPDGSRGQRQFELGQLRPCQNPTKKGTWPTLPTFISASVTVGGMTILKIRNGKRVKRRGTENTEEEEQLDVMVVPIKKSSIIGTEDTKPRISFSSYLCGLCASVFQSLLRHPDNKAAVTVGLRRLVRTLRDGQVELDQLDCAKNPTKIGTWPTLPT